jgi:signal transduction histidine kinase
MSIPFRQLLAYLRRPLALGVVGASVVALGMLFLGADLARRNLLQGVEYQHARVIDHFALSLHASGLLPSDRNAMKDGLAAAAGSDGFSDMVRRSVFGLGMAGLDVYTLDGSPLYSTEGRSPAVSPDGETFADARRGAIRSTMQGGRVLPGIDGDTGPKTVLSTFALIEDVSPVSGHAGRALAVIAVHSDVSRSLSALQSMVWRIVAVYVGGLGLIIFLTWRFSARARSRLEAANEALRVQYAAVRESRERMLSADEAVKRAIAEELHGSVQTKLYAVWMRLNALGTKKGQGDPELRLNIDKLAEEVDRIREEDIRKLSHRLHPSIIRMGALPGLRSLRDSYEHMIAVELSVGDEAAALESAGASRIPERVRLCAYRVAELALGNVVKHAEAKRCVVHWDYLPASAELRLIIEDDGKGFVQDPKAPTGIGLVTIRDYADSLNGRFEIESTPGKGTVVTVWIPAGLELSPLDVPLSAATSASQPAHGRGGGQATASQGHASQASISQASDPAPIRTAGRA